MNERQKNKAIIDLKTIIGTFVTETQSTNIHEFITWYDCKLSVEVANSLIRQNE